MFEKDLKKELKKSIKSANSGMSMTIRIILGEVPRLNKKKNEQVTEDEINGIIRKLIKSEITMLKYSDTNESTSEYLTNLKTFLPPLLSDNDISCWIKDNIDFNDYKNKMQAMGRIMAGLKGRADGNTVKEVLNKLN